MPEPARRLYNVKIALSIILAGLLLASCGGADAKDGARAQPQPSGGQILNDPPEPAYTEQEVVAKLGLTDGSDLGDEECVASVILTTPAAIELYAGAGDTVATNDAGTVGVKVGRYQGEDLAACARRFAKLMSDRLP